MNIRRRRKNAQIDLSAIQIMSENNILCRMSLLVGVWLFWWGSTFISFIGCLISHLCAFFWTKTTFFQSALSYFCRCLSLFAPRFPSFFFFVCFCTTTRYLFSFVNFIQPHFERISLHCIAIVFHFRFSFQPPLIVMFNSAVRGGLFVQHFSSVPLLFSVFEMSYSNSEMSHIFPYQLQTVHRFFSIPETAPQFYQFCLCSTVLNHKVVCSPKYYRHWPNNNRN